MEQENNWKINPTDTTLSGIDLKSGNNKTMYLDGYLSLNKNLF